MLGQTVIQFPVADAKTPAEALARSEAFLKEFANDELIVPALAPHSMYTLDRADAEGGQGDWRDRYKAPVLIHLAETAAESKTSMTRHKVSPTQIPGIDRILGSADVSPPMASGSARPTSRSSLAGRSASRTTRRAT